MKWEAVGADRESGVDRSVIIEAEDEESALRRASRRGVVVASIRPAGPDAGNNATATAAAPPPLTSTLNYATPGEPNPPASEPLPAPPSALKLTAKGETVFFNEGNCLVTSARVVIAGKTYALAHVTSVELVTITPDRGWFIALIAFGAILVILGVAGEVIGFSVVGGLLVVIGIVLVGLARPYHGMRMMSASGESQQMTSRERPDTASIVSAIEDAIIARR